MKRLLFVSISALIVASPASAKSAKWMDVSGAGLPTGAQMTVLSGNPMASGNFKVLIKMPANYTVPPHHHPTDEVVRARSGSLSYGMGDKLDKSNTGTLTDPKTHVTMHAGMNHYVFTTAPAEIEVSGAGPFQITYADPKDDPRGAK